jgi:hypothetical protein
MNLHMSNFSLHVLTKHFKKQNHFMKKQTLAVFGLATMALFSCKKQVEQTVEQKPKKVAINAAPPTLTFYNYGVDITENDFLDNPQDDADQAFNYVNHAMTLGLLEVYRNHPELMDAMVAAINTSTYKQKYLFEFAEVHPVINDIFNQVFASRFPDFGNYGGNWRTYVEARYVYDMNYVPVVAFLNSTWADPTKPAYISEPMEINEDKFHQFDDDYPMWLRQNGVDLFTTVNDHIVGGITNPIVAVRNDLIYTSNAHFLMPIDLFEGGGGTIAWPEDPTPVVPMSCGLNPLPPTHTHEDLISVGVRIDHRYEGSGDSEFRLYWSKSFGYKPASTAAYKWFEYAPSSGYPPYDQIELDLSKSQIGGNFAIPGTIFGPDTYIDGWCFDIPQMTSLLEYRGFVVGAFEWDWGHSPKKIGQLWIPGLHTIGDLNGRRKYQDEWYFFEPNSNVGYDFSVRNPTTNTTNSFWTKGHLQLRRQNH